MSNQEQKKTGGSSQKLLKVAIVGFIAGILLAPRAGKKMRQDLGSLYQKLKKEVELKAKKAEELTEQKYHEIVDRTVSAYKGAKTLKKEDLAGLAGDLKSCWVRAVRKAKPKVEVKEIPGEKVSQRTGMKK